SAFSEALISLVCKYSDHCIAIPLYCIQHSWKATKHFCVCVCVCVANLVLQQTVERIHVGKRYGDIPRGIFIVRGENVVLLGEIDLEKESDTSLQQVCIEDILEEQRLQQQSRQEAEKTKHLALKERGLVMPRSDIMDEYGVQHQY
uniref:LSM1 homolog, mRNA degradation associated n=1 Tax=Salmo trutta TaxID=8032 RepID=A0A674EJ84_SALTR